MKELVVLVEIVYSCLDRRLVCISYRSIKDQLLGLDITTRPLV